MKLKQFFPSVSSLLWLGFTFLQVCTNPASAFPQQNTQKNMDFLFIQRLVSDVIPEVRIPEPSPPEQPVSAKLPEPLTADQDTSAQVSVPPASPAASEGILPSNFALPEPAPASSPGSTADLSLEPSFSVMRRPPPADTSAPVPEQTANQPPASTSASVAPPSPPAGIITIRSVEPAAPVPAPASEPPPVAPKTTQTPPEPPGHIRVAEPETQAAPVREPLTLPVNPLPETPSQISSIIEPKKEALSSSRTIWALVGQQIEIPFQGNGWVYLGEQENRQGVTYNSRRSENEGQKYTFRADTAGTYTLKFYRQNYIEDYIINDYVQVIVSENPGTAGTERSRVSPAPQQTETVSIPIPVPAPAPASAVQPPIVQAAAAAPVPAIDYLQQAKEAYTAGQFPQAITLLDQFREQYPSGTDEAWWLYGQSLEANSSSRDIRSALDYYRRLIQEYPQSPRGTDAQRRIAYLERYYFNIR